MTDWGAHHNDIAQWGLGMDGSGPVSVTATGVTPSKKPNSYNCHPHFAVSYDMPTEPRLITTSDGENGNRFIGDRGWIFVNRERIEASDPKLLEEPLPRDAHRLYKSNDHMGNFMDCIKSRKRCICDVEIGYRSVSVCHIGAIALRLGIPLDWDPSPSSSSAPAPKGQRDALSRNAVAVEAGGLRQRGRERSRLSSSCVSTVFRGSICTQIATPTIATNT